LQKSRDFVYFIKMNTEALQSVAVAMASEQSVDKVLQVIVEGLAQQSCLALARIWLVGEGDICAVCPMRGDCPQQERCLHLAASKGASLAEATDWSDVAGAFRRFPLNVKKIGRIGATGEPLHINNIAADNAWIARPEWIKREQIRSFAGEPLIFRGEILGVLGVFRREPLLPEDISLLKLYAGHAAVAIANARAFEEIAALKHQLELENDYLREEVNEAFPYDEIVGRSEALQKVLRQIELVAPAQATVLITGESGTGKELIARAIHARSPRQNRPLIKVNCAAIAPELFESEFFGHVRGAFTGAVKDRTGRFQLADGGTLLLDEVGEIPLALQGKLLRVLQEGEFEKVGEDRTRKVDARLVAATNRDLLKEVDAGRFRQDLYYRLSVFPLHSPPLRERPEDIPLLAAHLANLAARRLNCPRLQLSPQNIRQLQNYNWPGNVRELQNVIERAAIQQQCGQAKLDFSNLVAAPAKPVAVAPSSPLLTKAELHAQERASIIAALEQAEYKIYGARGAAEILGMKPTTLASRMKTLNIRKQVSLTT
jgi:transcriptional regulator with GAF, ATPase, and Fis domain